MARRGLRLEPGVVVDPNISQVGMMLFGTDDPRVALVGDYPDHEITRNFNLIRYFHRRCDFHVEGEWRATLLRTLSIPGWSRRGQRHCHLR